MKNLLFITAISLLALNAQAQNVGIGTTTPLQKLHVEGATFLNGNVGIGASTPAFPLSFASAIGDKISLWPNSTNSYGFGIQSSLLQIHTDISAADIAFGYGSSAAFTERMRIKGNGRVGIGTSIPTSMLDVNGQITIDQKNFGGYGGLLIKGDAPGSAYPNIGFSIKNNAATPQDIISAVMLGTINNNTAGAESMDLSFMTSTSGQAGLTERLFIKDNGKIGIGTNSPNAPLGFPATLEKKITLFPGSTGDAGFGVFGNELRIASDYSGADITFGYDNRTSGFTETMRIKGNGNVGLGVTDPYFKADISGRIRLRTSAEGEPGIFLNNAANTNLQAFIGLENDNYVGFYGAAAGWKFGMNTQTGALKINGTEGTTGQVLTSNASGATSTWDFPVKTYQWSLPSYIITSTTEVSILNQNVTATTNSSFIISAQFTINSCMSTFSNGVAYLYIDGIKLAPVLIKVDGNYSQFSVISLPNFIFNGGPGTHSLEIRVKKFSGSCSMEVLNTYDSVVASYVSVIQVAR